MIDYLWSLATGYYEDIKHLDDYILGSAVSFWRNHVAIVDGRVVAEGDTAFEALKKAKKQYPREK